MSESASADRPGAAKNHGFGHERAKNPSARALTSCAGCCRPQDASGMPNGPKNPKTRKTNRVFGVWRSARGPPRGPACAPLRACAAVKAPPVQFTLVCVRRLTKPCKGAAPCASATEVKVDEYVGAPLPENKHNLPRRCFPCSVAKRAPRARGGRRGRGAQGAPRGTPGAPWVPQGPPWAHLGPLGPP